MGPMQRTVRRTALALALALTVVLLPACGSSSDGLAGTTVTMPVLWAGTGADGSAQSGIEPARVTVGNLGSTAFGMDLRDVEAKKAGPQWLAATSSAAAVAVFASAKDPADIDVRYQITGQIDGPSGGAILTVGTLAAIRGDTLADDITMTGTITPDSFVGKVGGIPDKLRAAAKAGYKRVLLPVANLTASGESSTSDMIEYGRTLGLEVRGVQLLTEAYEAFTGVRLAATSRTAVELSPPVVAAARATTTALIDRLRTQSAGASIPAPDAQIVAKGIADASAALAAGDTAGAYGIAVDAAIALERALGTAKVTATIAASGVNAARDALRAEVTSLRARAAEVLRTGSDVAAADPIVQLVTPYALGWVTYADAVLAGIEQGLQSGEITAAGLTVTGAAIGEQRVSIEELQTDALTMVRAAPNPGVVLNRPAEGFLSDYGSFMATAGKANVDYYLSVVSRNRSTRTDANGNPLFNLLALDALGEGAASTPAGVQPIDDEVRQTAIAATYYVIGAGLVSNTSDKGFGGSGIGTDATITTNTDVIEAELDDVSGIIEDYGVALRDRNVDAGSPLWSSRWGLAAARALSGTDRALAGAVIAQNEIWYDVISLASIWAATTPR